MGVGTYALAWWPNLDGKGMAIEIRRVDMRDVFPDVNALAPAPRGETVDKGPAAFEKVSPLAPRDGHLTRDLTERIWASLDGAWYTGGQATIAGVQGEKLNNLGIGITLGYQVNDNLGLTVGYKSTVNDKAPGDLQMDGFMVSLVAGWHPLIESAKRLKGE
jgi:hypothetical protein